MARGRRSPPPRRRSNRGTPARCAARQEGRAHWRTAATTARACGQCVWPVGRVEITEHLLVEATGNRRVEARQRGRSGLRHGIGRLSSIPAPAGQGRVQSAGHAKSHSPRRRERAPTLAAAVARSSPARTRGRRGGFRRRRRDCTARPRPSLLELDLPAGPPLPSKPDPLAGFTYRGPLRSQVAGCTCSANNPRAWLLPAIPVGGGADADHVHAARAASADLPDGRRGGSTRRWLDRLAEAMAVRLDGRGGRQHHPGDLPGAGAGQLRAGHRRWSGSTTLWWWPSPSWACCTPR